MKKLAIMLAMAVGMVASFGNRLDAALVAGTYTLGGQTTGTGPYQLTSTDSTFSVLRFVPTTAPLFSDLTNFNVIFNSPIANALGTQTPLNAGGGGGAPRIVLVLDTNNDSLADGQVGVHLGTSPSFVDTPATLTALSGMNLINNDVGRYDLSAFTPNPGSNFTDYNAALAAVGNATVLRFSLILDSFNGADKTLDVEGISADAVTETAAPEASTLAIWSLLGLCGSAVAWRNKKRSIA